MTTLRPLEPHLLGAVLALLLGCVQENAPAADPDPADAAAGPDGAAPAPDARPDESDAAPEEPDAAPLDLPDPGPLGPGDADGDGRCDAEAAFHETVAAAAARADSYTCRRADDCVEVELCTGEFCTEGVPLNTAAAAAIDAIVDPDARCEDCGPEEPLECPEPEPIPVGCSAGICSRGGGSSREPPTDCGAAVDAFQRALDVIADSLRYRCEDDADCAAIMVSTGCSGGLCAPMAMHVDSVVVAEAQLDAHLRFNACDLCPDAPADCPPARAACREEVCRVAEP